MKPKKSRLTKTDIDSFVYEGNGNSRDVRWDDAISEFGLRVYPTGQKSFVLSYRNESRTKRLLTLGSYGPLTLSAARKLATQRKAEIITGRDPTQERKDAREAPNRPDLYQAVVEEFIEKYAKPRHRTWKQTEHVLISNCAAWLKRPIGDISKSDAYRLIEGIQAGGAEAKARMTLAWLRTLFKWAVKRDYLETSIMEAVDVEFHRVVREIYFEDDQIRALWNGCNSLDAVEGAYLKLLMLLGVRKNELAGMRRTEFRKDDENREIWAVPHSRTKTKKTQQKKREYIVPIPPLASRILRSLPKIKGEDLMFPGRHKRNALRPNTDLKTKLIKASGVESFTYHATRHTVASWMGKNGFSEFEIGLVLNHSTASVTSNYSHNYPTALKLELLGKWADHVAGLVQPNGAILLS